MSCGHLADGVRAVLGDGASVGVRLRYMEEPRPLGYRWRAEVRRGPARRPLPDAQRRRAHRSRPVARRSPRTSASGARATLALYPVEDPSRLRARAAQRATASVTRVRREAGAGPDRHQQHLRRRLRARALGARRCWCAGEPRLDRARRLPARSSATASTATSRSGYWMDIGTPERYLEATFDILEGDGRAPRSPRAWATTFVCVEDGVASGGPDRPGRAGRERAAGSATAPGSAAARCSSTASSVGEGTTIESAVVMQGAVDRRALHAARLHRRRGRADRRPLRDRRHERDRRGRDARRRQRRLQRRAALPRRDAAGRGAEVLMTTLDRATRSPRSTRTGPARRGARAGRAPARRAVARGLRRRAAGRRPRRRDRRRHGRLGRRRAARARRARPAADAAVRRRRRLRAAGLGRAVDARARARATRATPRRRCRPTTTPRARGAPRMVATTGGALAERARRDGVPVIPLPGGFQPRAAIGYSLVGALEAARWPARRRRCATEIEAAAALAETLAAEWGPDGAGGLAGQVDRARAARHGAGDRRRRARRRRRPTAGSASSTRTRSCRRSRRCCRRPTTTRSSAGTRRASSAAFSYVSLEDPAAHPAQRAAGAS